MIAGASAYSAFAPTPAPVSATASYRLIVTGFALYNCSGGFSCFWLGFDTSLKVKMNASSVSQSSTLVPNRESSASAGQPLLPLPKHDATKIDAKVVNHIEQKLRKFEPFIKQRSKRRAVLGLTLGSTGSALTSSGGLSSTNLRAASTAFARLSAHLDDILQNTQREETQSRPSL